MRKILLLCVVYMVTFPQIVAAAKFKIDTDTQFNIASDGVTTVTQKFILEPEKEYYVPEKFTFNLGLRNILFPQATSSGQLLKMEIQEASSEAILTVDTQGALFWTVTYQTSDIAKKVGRLWQIFAPERIVMAGIAESKFEYSIPLEFGKEIIKNRLYDPSGSPVAYQAYNFFKSTQMTNQNWWPIIQQVPLSAELHGKRVFNYKISHRPLFDQEILLWPRTTIIASISGTVVQVIDKNGFVPLSSPFVPVDINLDLK